jgi:hypothetical protein
MDRSHTQLGKFVIFSQIIPSWLPEHRQIRNNKRPFFIPFRQSSSSTEILKFEGNHGYQTETEKLTILAAGSHDNLFVAKTVFPFVLFADTLKIDRQKVTIVHNNFFWTSQTVSTEIKNIMNIEVDVGPLFGSITITSKHFLNNSQTIRYLKRSAVTCAQRLLQGFMIAQRAKINTDSIDKKQLLILLNDLGQENQK